MVGIETIFLSSCNWVTDLPEGSITIKVVDEEGKPFESANVGLGFEKNTNKGTEKVPVKGASDCNGVFTGIARTINYVSYRVSKDGYYDSWGEYKFQNRSGGRWEPWNPEIKVVLRRIENPVPMYARKFVVEIPVIGKGVGFDLIEYDWVKPYGKGSKSDFIFRIDKDFKSRQEFDATLTITFSNKFDGIQVIKEDLSTGSRFKLPRFAPENGYVSKLLLSEKRELGKSIRSSSEQDNSYIFRIRSEEKNNKFIRSMYGKIQRDIGFDVVNSKTGYIAFKYYLNSDYTRNLEFDPSRNLFTNLGITERVGLE